MDERRPGAAGAVVPASRVRLSDEAVRIGEQKPGDEHADPRIQLIREDGVIRAIEVTCSCGELIRIRCEYS